MPRFLIEHLGGWTRDIMFYSATGIEMLVYIVIIDITSNIIAELESKRKSSLIKHDQGHVHVVLKEETVDLIQGDCESFFVGVSIDTRRNQWKRDTLKPINDSKLEAGAVRTAQHLLLAVVTVLPDRTNGMDHEFRG